MRRRACLTDPTLYSIHLVNKPNVAEQVEIQIKYQGYIDRQMEQVERFRKTEKMRIPDDLDYSEVPSLSREVRDKLSQIRPISIGQASRISGITPAALSILMVYLKGRARKKENLDNVYPSISSG